MLSVALDTYAHLQTTIADWLNRSDLTGSIPDMITLAEAEMKRRLRRTSVRVVNYSITAESNAPPADLAELRSAWLISAEPSRDVPLRMGTQEMLVERNARGAGIASRPSDIAFVGGQIIVAPPPDKTYTAGLVYYSTLSPLSVSNTVNVVLTEAPDAYLFGALLHAEGYLEHDDRIALWKGKFDAAIDQLNDVRDREEHNASLQAVRLPMVFG